MEISVVISGVLETGKSVGTHGNDKWTNGCVAAADYTIMNRFVLSTLLSKGPQLNVVVFS